MSAESETHLCNLALTRLGNSVGITNIATDTSKAGDLCRAHYDVTRDLLLRMHSWNFAVKRVELASVVAVPAFEYDYAFALPTDCLKVIRTSWEAAGYAAEDGYQVGYWQSPSIPYRIEQGHLLCNESTCSIEYIARITDTSKFDALFTDVFAQRLAAELAMPLTDNQAWTKTAWDMYSAKLAAARTNDAQEGSSRDVIDTNAWLMARR